MVYPESHIIRIHRHILEWELGIREGKIFDFGCGNGGHLKYFTDHGFTPYGCDVSQTAIAGCKQLMPEYSENFYVTPAVKPDLLGLVGAEQFTVFLSNQALYYLEDEGIRDINRQAYDLLCPQGVFIATMMAYSCYYARYITGESGDYKKIEIDTPRQKETAYINFKHKEALESLFRPFKKLHIGKYGNYIREEEGPTDHWIYVGVR